MALNNGRGKTQDGEWVLDKDLTGERVVLSLLQGEGAEARLTLKEATGLGQALVDVAAEMRVRLQSMGLTHGEETPWP